MWHFALSTVTNASATRSSDLVFSEARMPLKDGFYSCLTGLIARIQGQQSKLLTARGRCAYLSIMNNYPVPVLFLVFSVHWRLSNHANDQVVTKNNLLIGQYSYPIDMSSSQCRLYGSWYSTEAPIFPIVRAIPNQRWAILPLLVE